MASGPRARSVLILVAACLQLLTPVDFPFLLSRSRSLGYQGNLRDAASAVLRQNGSTSPHILTRTDLVGLCLFFSSNFKLVAVSSKLYAIGGQAVSNVECYSPEQDAWNFVAPLPNPLAEFSACECKGKIYVIGGYTTRGE